MKQNKKTYTNITDNNVLLTMSAQDIFIPEYCEVNQSSKDYILYGKDNKFPQYLFDLYLRSAILQAIVNGTADYVGGDGIKVDPSLEYFQNYTNKEGDTLEDIVRKITIDYLIYGGFAVSPVFNAYGDLVDIYWVDYGRCRISKDKFNEDGTPADRMIFYCNNWGDSRAKVVVREEFDGTNRYNSPIFCYKGHISRGDYAVPLYAGSLKAIETGAQIQEFHLRNITNGFSGSKMITFNDGIPTIDKQKELKDKIVNNLTGSKNAGDFVLSFAKDKEHAPTVENLADDGFDKKFAQLETSTMKNIFVSFRAQPQLFGFVIEGSLFNKDEYAQAFALYNKTMVQPIQKDLQRAFDKLFNKDNSIVFIPFSIDALNTDK